MKTLLKVAPFMAVAALLAACSGNESFSNVPPPQFKASSISATAQPAASEYYDLVQRIYVGYFGRPADPAGLQFWANYCASAGLKPDLAGLLASYDQDPRVRQFLDGFGLSQESQDLYPGDNNDFITSVYQNVLGRSPDTDGKAFWVHALDTHQMTRAIAVLRIMTGAQSTDVSLINKKVEVAKNFTTLLQDRQQAALYVGMTANARVRETLREVMLGTDTSAFYTMLFSTIDALQNGQAKTQYLPFVYGTPTPSGYMMGAVDDEGMGSASVIAKVTGLPTLFSEFQLSNGMVSKVALRLLPIWVEGRLNRQDLVGRDGLPQRNRISTLSSSQVCDQDATMVTAGISSDYTDASKSWIVWRNSGLDQQCKTSDDQFLAVRMDMSETDSPIVVEEPVAALNSKNGQLIGWLQRRGQEIWRVNSDFGGGKKMFDLPRNDFITKTQLVGILSNEFFFQSGSAIYRWDASRTAPADPELIASLQSGEQIAGVDAIDENDVFILVRSSFGASAGRVLRYSLENASCTQVGVIQRTSSLSSISMALTPTRVIVYDSLGAVSSVLRTGGAQQVIYTPPDREMLRPTVTVAGERLWIGLPTTRTVVLARSDGSDVQIKSDSLLAGCFEKPLISINATNSDCYAIVLVEKGSVRAYEAATASFRLEYGEIPVPTAPAPAYCVIPFPTNWGDGSVLTLSTVGAAPNTSVAESFYIRSDRPGVLPLIPK